MDKYPIRYKSNHSKDNYAQVYFKFTRTYIPGSKEEEIIVCNFSNRGFYATQYRDIDYLEMYQLAASLGYAIPFMGHSVQNLLEANYFKYATS